MREAVDEFLAEPPGDGLGVSTAWVLDVLHGLVLFNGALAAAAAVLAVYVFQRHRAARIGFSVAAGLLLLTSPFSGGAMAMILAFAAVMLWSRPARDWFAGREPAPAPASAAAPSAAARSCPTRGPLPGAAANTPGGAASGGRSMTLRAPRRPRLPHDTGRPRAARPGGVPVRQPSRPGLGPARLRPAAGLTPSWAAGTAQDPDRRPAGVIVRRALTWLFAGLTAAGVPAGRG